MRMLTTASLPSTLTPVTWPTVWPAITTSAPRLSPLASLKEAFSE